MIQRLMMYERIFKTVIWTMRLGFDSNDDSYHFSYLKINHLIDQHQINCQFHNKCWHLNRHLHYFYGINSVQPNLNTIPIRIWLKCHLWWFIFPQLLASFPHCMQMKCARWKLCTFVQWITLFFSFFLPNWTFNTKCGWASKNQKFREIKPKMARFVRCLNALSIFIRN